MVEKSGGEAAAGGGAELASIILDEMLQLVGILDARGINLLSNKTSLEASGLRREDVIGIPFWETPWWPPETRAEVRAAVEQAGRGETVRKEITIVGRPGEPNVVLDFSVKPVRDGAGAVRYIIPEGRDITAKKIAEEALERRNAELRALNERLSELDRVKSQLFANLSHELRTPLALILGLADRLRQKLFAAAAPVSRDVGEIERHAAGLLRQVNDLLDLARLEEGRLILDYADTDLAELTRRVASSFETLAADRALAFSVDTPATLHAAVDPDQVERVLVNLLANAFKFTAAGKVRCSLAESDGRAHLHIADSGPGIPVEQREAVFERFFQVEGGSTRRHGGVGLGLALVREVVQLHGGRVRAEAAPEGGALLEVLLPLAAPAGVAVAPRRAPRAVAAPPAALYAPRPDGDSAAVPADDGRPLVLLVEDNRDMSRFLAEQLGERYRVVTAFDGREGLERARAVRPDLVLTDVMMPRMSGDDLVREIRAVPELDGVPIVVLTARDDDELRVRLLEAGAQDHVTKPVQWRELGARIDNLVALRRTRVLLERELSGQRGSLEQLAGSLAAERRELATTLDALQRSEAQVRQMQKVQAIGSLAAGVAHDFNNVLSIILGTCAILERDVGRDDRALESVTVIGEAARRAAGLTRQLLAFSRQQVLAPRVLDLNQTLLDMQPMLDRLVGASVDLRLQVASRPAYVKVDPSQLEQVILNLVVNARDALPSGGTVNVTTSHVDRLRRAGPSSPEPHVILAVADDGVGMDEVTLARIFEPFFTTKESGRGTGLGLATVLGIVEQSDGEVEVASQPGRGSTFRVYMPRSLEEPRAPSSAPAGLGVMRGGETVLLVEDDAEVRRVLRRILDAGGYAVIEARHGADAVRLADGYGGAIHLLITDVVMPRMNGLELAAKLAAPRPKLRTLYMSGYSDDALLSHQAPVAFLQKPILPDALIHKVREVLDAP